MHTQPLFLDKPLTFSEKNAGALTPMGDNSEMWPQEVVDEAYRQLPFLSDFDVHAVVDRVDEERGYAMGSIEVRPVSRQTVTEMEQAPVKGIQIPFIVREKKMAPLDIFIDGKSYHHLTEGRVRSSLFRPDIFDTARDRPPEPSLYADLQPPLEANVGLGGGGVKLAAGIPSLEEKNLTPHAKKILQRQGWKPGKPLDDLDLQDAMMEAHPEYAEPGYSPEMSKRLFKVAMLTPILPLLHGQVRSDHVDRLKVAMQDPSMRVAVSGADEGVRAAFESAMQVEASDPEKSAAVAWEAIPPSVVQLRKLSSGNYILKMANAEMYEPREEEVGPEQGEQLLSDLDLTAEVESDGTITASPDPTVKRTLDAEEIRVVDQPGIWKVQDKMGNTLTGWAFPQLLSLDMQPMPLTLFTNGSEYSVQEHVAGALLGKGADLPRGRLQGYGALYYIDHGNPKVFVPMTVRNSYQSPDGSLHYTAFTDLEEEVDLVFTPGLKTVVKMGEMEYAVPEEFSKCWLPLKARTELVSKPLMFTKYASMDGARPVSSLGEIVSDGNVYSYRGAPFSKVASSQVTFLDRNDAEFVGVAAGVCPSLIKQALDEAAKGEVVAINGLRTLWDPKEKIARAKVKVAKALEGVNLRNYDLIKEATILDDALTADKILGLGFLNAENVSTFVDMLPGFEYALSQLAEMLMASRLGLKDIPEVALERAKVQLEDVIQGLRTLKQREVSYKE